MKYPLEVAKVALSEDLAFEFGAIDYSKGVKLRDNMFVKCDDGKYDRWRAGWRKASRNARQAKLTHGQLAFKAGDNCKWRDEHGDVHTDTISNIYTSAMGNLCAEMVSGQRIRVRELFC